MSKDKSRPSVPTSRDPFLRKLIEMLRKKQQREKRKRQRSTK